MTDPDGLPLAVVVVSKPTERRIPPAWNSPQSPLRVRLPTKSGHFVQPWTPSVGSTSDALPVSIAALGASSENASFMPLRSMGV